MVLAAEERFISGENGGISHMPREYSNADACGDGTDVLANAVLRLANQPKGAAAAAGSRRPCSDSAAWAATYPQWQCILIGACCWWVGGLVAVLGDAVVARSLVCVRRGWCGVR